MQMKKKLLVLVMVIISQTISNNCIADGKMLNTIYEKYPDVIIGYMANDSTGIVTITNLQIQQSMISIIPLISQSIIVNKQPFISVGETSTYLIFQVTSSSRDTINVAVGLTTLANNLSFASNGKREIHFCKNNKSCGKCGFAMDTRKKIIGCYIKKTRKTSGNESETFLIND